MSSPERLVALQESVAKFEKIAAGFRTMQQQLRELPVSQATLLMIQRNAETLASAERSLAIAKEALAREQSAWQVA